MPDAARELVADLFLGLLQDPLPRLARRQRGDALELLSLAVLQELHVLLELLQVLLAVGDALFAARQLGHLARDVLLLRDHALLDLDHRVAPLPQLRLELGAHLDGLLPRLDPRLAPCRLGVALGLLEEAFPLAAGGIET